MREIYLNNDHRVNYLVGERTKGIYISGLTLSASLSLNPTGSAAAPYTLGTSSLASSSFASSSTSESVYAGSITHSYIWETHALESFYDQQVITGTLLEIVLTESPPASSEYVGTFNGGDIAQAFTLLTETTQSLNLSGSFAEYTSSISESVSESVIMYVTQSFVNHVTSSVQEPIPAASPRWPGVYEIITSGSHIQVSTPLVLRSVRFAP